MARWFWYVSSAKLGSLKQPERGWGILRQRFKTADIEAGVPWAKLSTHAEPGGHVIESVEKIEREIRRDHAVPASDEITEDGGVPLFFRFEGLAGHLLLRESYEDEGECVFLAAGYQGTTGVLLLGAGSHVFGSAAATPRHVNPSVDPVGALLVLMERQASGAARTRAGIARDADGFSPEECVRYSMQAALREIQQRSFMYPVRALAITSVIIPCNYLTPDVHIDRIIVGSPIYVEQLDSRT